MKYWNKHGQQGMMGKFGQLSSYPFYFYKNSSNIVSFDVKLTTIKEHKVSYAYITEEDFKTIPKSEIKSKYILTQTISKIDSEYLSLEGKKHKDDRNTRNKYDKIVSVKTKPNSIEEVLSLIDIWDAKRGDLVYNWQKHSGYDRSFFTRFYEQEKENLQCLFFYIKGKLVGYSVISLVKDDEAYVFCLGKCDTEYKDISWYIDFRSFDYLLCDEEYVLINWGASSGSLLKYKMRFPVHSLEKLYFFKKV